MKVGLHDDWACALAGIFLAFLPELVNAASPQRALACLLLGTTLLLTGTTWCVVIAIDSARASTTIRHSSTAGRLIRRQAGAVFDALGIRLVVAQSDGGTS